MKSHIIFIFLFLLVVTPVISSEIFGFDNPNLPKLVQELFGGKPSSFYMPNNKTVFGNFSFDGTCLNGGVEIKQGTICGQTLQVFNITNLNVTKQSLTITDNLTVQGNISADNFIGNIFGNSSIWSRAGANTFLTNSGDNVGIGTSTPSKKLEVSGDTIIVGDLEVNDILSFTESKTGSRTIKVEDALAGDPGNSLNISAGNAGFDVSDPLDGGDVIINGGINNGAGLVGDVLLATLRGLVGIGTPTPQNELNVIGDINATGDVIVGGNLSYSVPTGSDFLCVEKVGSICTRGYNATCQFVFSTGGISLIEVCD